MQKFSKLKYWDRSHLLYQNTSAMVTPTAIAVITAMTEMTTETATVAGDPLLFPSDTVWKDRHVNKVSHIITM